MIGANPEKVFDYLADFSHHPDWAAHRSTVTKTSPGPAGVGTTFASDARMTGSKFHDDLTITEFVPNDRIVFEVTGDAGKFRHTFLLRQEWDSPHQSGRATAAQPDMEDPLADRCVRHSPYPGRRSEAHQGQIGSAVTIISRPDSRGRYGPYGGQYGRRDTDGAPSTGWRCLYSA